MEAETQNTLKGLFRLVSEFVQDEIKSKKSIADLNQRIDGITEAQNHSRVNVFNEIVRTYPYPELRECDREIFKSMCLNGKKSLEVIEDKYSLGEALRLWKSREETPEKLKTLAQSALAPLNIHKKNNEEIQQLLEYSVNKANKKVLAVRKSVTEWLLTIKRAIDAREKVRRERQSRRPRNEIADVEAVRKMMSSEKDIKILLLKNLMLLNLYKNLMLLNLYILSQNIRENNWVSYIPLVPTSDTFLIIHLIR